MIRSLFIFCLSFSLVAAAKPTVLKRKPADFYSINAAILNSPLKNSIKANIYFGHYTEADRQRALADMNRWMKPPQFRATRSSIIISSAEQAPIEIQFKRLSPEKSEVVVNGKSLTLRLSDGYRSHTEQLESLMRASKSAGLKNLLFPQAEASIGMSVFGVGLVVGGGVAADVFLDCDPNDERLYRDCLVQAQAVTTVEQPSRGWDQRLVELFRSMSPTYVIGEDVVEILDNPVKFDFMGGADAGGSAGQTK